MITVIGLDCFMNGKSKAMPGEVRGGVLPSRFWMADGFMAQGVIFRQPFHVSDRALFRDSETAASRGLLWFPSDRKHISGKKTRANLPPLSTPVAIGSAAVGMSSGNGSPPSGVSKPGQKAGSLPFCFSRSLPTHLTGRPGYAKIMEK
ncbi:hypothetical protein [Desulfococcus sp.]|uniref:hypothetical protein n=1 Tax=Desulfococcus sp. TaxID=2025834 RepID=UPI0035948215